MATFGEVLGQFQEETHRRHRESPQDFVRRTYLRKLHDLTGRNVVVYYSGWLQKQGPEHFLTTQINDEDKHGFMATFAGLDFSRGLDLILHTPGGDVAATESIIDYIRSKFNDDIRVIVPQISMSGGTMIALAGKTIVMGRHSNLGPIDPQLGGKPAIAILKEFEQAKAEITENPSVALVWQPILQHYQPTLLSFAKQSIDWAREIGKKALLDGMFKGAEAAEQKSAKIVEFMLSQDLHKAHGRHIHRNELQQIGLNILSLEDNPDLQDAVLTIHHACMLTVGNTAAGKLIENHNGIAHIKLSGQIHITQSPQLMAQPSAMAAEMPTPRRRNVRRSFIIALAKLFKVDIRDTADTTIN